MAFASIRRFVPAARRCFEVCALLSACGSGSVPAWEPPPRPADLGAPFDAALERAERAVRAAPLDARAVEHLALIYEANDRRVEARACFRRARECDPSESANFVHEAWLLKEEGDLEEALAVARAGTALHPSDPALLDVLGNAALQADELDEAASAFRALVASASDSPRGHLGLGEVALARGDAEAALPALERAVELDRSGRGAHYALGRALSELGRTEDAELALRRGAGAARERMADRWTAQLVRLSFNRTTRNKAASELLNAGKAADALALLEETLGLDPTDARTLSNLGLAHRALGQHDRALEVLRRAVAAAPESFQPHVNYGQVLLETGKTAEALEEARQAIRTGPRVAKTHMLASEALWRLGRDAEAADELEQALDCAPSDVAMRLHAARQLVRVDAERAREHLERAVALAPLAAEPEALLAEVLGLLGRKEEAEQHARRARELSAANATRRESAKR